MVPYDSAAIETGSSDFHTSWNTYRKLQIPLSIGMEYQIPIGKYHYQLGVKALRAFHHTYYKTRDMTDYVQILAYLGMRIPVTKRMKKPSGEKSK